VEGTKVRLMKMQLTRKFVSFPIDDLRCGRMIYFASFRDHVKNYIKEVPLGPILKHGYLAHTPESETHFRMSPDKNFLATSIPPLMAAQKATSRRHHESSCVLTTNIVLQSKSTVDFEVVISINHKFPATSRCSKRLWLDLL
jgi:hypothetical protein